MFKNNEVKSGSSGALTLDVGAKAIKA